MKKWLLIGAVMIAMFSFAPASRAAGPSRVVYSVIILSPAGEEEWQAGRSYEIRWQLSGFSDGSMAAIQYVSANGGRFYTMVRNYPADKDSYLWSIPKDFIPGKYRIWLSVTTGTYTRYVGSKSFSIVEYQPVWVQRDCLLTEAIVTNVGDAGNDQYVGVELIGAVDGQGREVQALAPFFFQSALSALKVYGSKTLSVFLLTVSVPDDIPNACSIDPESIGSTFYIGGMGFIDFVLTEYGYGKSGNAEKGSVGKGGKNQDMKFLLGR